MEQQSQAKRFSWSIRRALNLIVLLAVLPAMGIIAVTGWESKTRAEKNAVETAQGLIRSLGAMHQGIVGEAKGVLTTLAMLPIVRMQDREACNWLFAGLLKGNPGFANIVLTDLEGKVAASARPEVIGMDLSDRKYFQEALANKGFSVGDYTHSRATGQPVQVFSLPVRDADGSVTGVLGMSCPLDAYEKFLAGLKLPPSARVTLSDYKGMRMLAYPSSPAYPLGKPVTADVWERMRRSPGDEGMIRAARPSGEEGPLVFKRLRLSEVAPPHMNIGVSFTDEDIFKDANRLLVRDLGLVLLAAALALFMARLIRDRLILRDLEMLVSAARRLGGGDLSARADSVKGCRETRQLSASFNDMAQALETRQGELEDAAKALGKMRNMLNNILESMPSAVIGLDGRRAVTHWNSGAERLTGLAANSALGRPLDEAFPWLAEQVPSAGSPRSGERVTQFEGIPLPGAEDARYVDVLAYPLVANGVDGAVVRVDDVTKRVRLEMLMVQNEKMSIMGSLAGGMAHEINNPLSGILQSVQNIQRRVQPSMEANRKAAQETGTTVEAVEAYLQARGILGFLETIKDSGQRAARIVKNMLGFIRKSASAHIAVQLPELLDRTLEIAATDYDLTKKFDFRSIAVVRKYDPDVPTVFCSPTDLEQVVYNLLANAAQAMAGAASPDRPPRLILRLRREDDFAVMEIEDNGPGMEEHVRRRVFEPLFSTKGPGEGTGLGLSLVYFIVVNTYGGSISVESEKGAGARFIIKLPLNRVEPGGARQA